MSVVVSNFDKTIYNDNIERNIEAIKNYIKRGNTFIIATGRNFNTLLNKIEKYNLPIEYYICNDGAVIYDRYQNILYRKDIDSLIGKKIYNELLNEDNNLEVFIECTSGITTNSNIPINKLISRYLDKDEAIMQLSHIVNNYDVLGYIDDTYINIISSKVSKGKAISYLTEFYNFDSNDIYTIGLNVNDMDMVANFLGFSTTDAIIDIKNKSYKVLNSIDELIDRL